MVSQCPTGCQFKPRPDRWASSPQSNACRGHFGDVFGEAAAGASKPSSATPSPSMMAAGEVSGPHSVMASSCQQFRTAVVVSIIGPERS